MQTNLTLATVLALACAAGCHKQTASADSDAAPVASTSSSAPAVAATAPDETDVDAGEVAPPDAVVAQDPDIPVNEAVVGTPPTASDVTADVAPPTQAAIEQQPPTPDPADVWVPGYWWWSRPLHRYVWVGGAWRQPPPDQIWTPGRWALANGHYGWTPGYWGPRGFAHEVIDVGPPPMRVEVRPVAPGADYVWTPGYYGWRGGRYEWTAGAWARPPRVGVGWVEPRYVNIGGHYTFQPGRWDYAPEHRGVVYHPDINVRPGVRVKLEPVAPTVVVSHARFVADSSRAIARGAVRNERGAFVMPPRGNVAVDVHGPNVRVDERVKVEGPRAEHVTTTVENGRHEETRVTVTAPHPEVRERVDVHVTTPTQPQRREDPRRRR